MLAISQSKDRMVLLKVYEEYHSKERIQQETRHQGKIVPGGFKEQPRDWWIEKVVGRRKEWLKDVT